MTPAPLPVPLEQLVIVDIVDGIADTTLVHLPAARLHRGGIRFDSFTFPPATWPAKCRAISSGSVYVHAGMLEHAVLCADCEAKP